MAATAPAWKPRELPASQTERIRKIRDQMLRDANAAVGRFAGPLRERADVLIRKVWAARENPEAVRKLVSSFWVQGKQPLADAVADIVMDAALYAERYEEALVDFKVRMRHPLPDTPAAGQVKAIGDYETYFRLNYGEPGARAAMAYAYKTAETRAAKRGIHAEYERARKQHQVRQVRAAEKRLTSLERFGHGAPVAKTPGDVLAQKHLRPFNGIDGLSTHLHGTAVTEGREASRVVLRSIREAENAGRAARDLQRLVKKEGHKIAANARQPKLVEELIDAGRALSKSAGDPALRQRWLEIQMDLWTYQKGLASGGTVQNAYLELLQDVADPKFKARNIKSVVNKWSYQKQRYQAERIIKTEQASAYRIEQMAKQAKQPWIIGYRWEMAKALHAKKMRRRGRSKKLGGKRCICEAMSGQILTVEIMAQYPAGGHPHCMCAFIPIYSEARLMSADITPEEEAWFAAQDL